jgi:hypothetical protein
VSTGDGVVHVRNTAEPDVQLPLTTEQWRSLVDALKADAFVPEDPPASKAEPPAAEYPG